MKSLVLILMFCSLLFSEQMQIVVGCFEYKENSLKRVDRFQEHLKEDKTLSKLFVKYNLKLEVKKVGDYNVVTLSAFQHYPQLFLMISKVKKYYKDSYVLEYPFESKSIKKMFIKPVVVEKKVVQKKQIIEEKLIPKVEKKVKKVKKVDTVDKELDYIYDQQKIEKPQNSKQEVVVVQEDKDYFYEMIGAGIFLLLLIAGGVLYFRKDDDTEIKQC